MLIWNWYIYHMKKALLTFTLLVLATAGFSQQCLFEKTYTKGLTFETLRSSPTEMVSLADGWLVVGYKFSCSSAYTMFVDCNGDIVWEHFADAGYSTYTDIQKIDTLVYVSGIDLFADDVPETMQNAFVDIFSPTGFKQRLITDTSFTGGFGSIYVDSARIVTIVSKETIAGIGYWPTIQIPFDYVNVYNRSGNLSQPSLSLQIDGLKDAFLIDSSIIVQTFNGYFSYDLSGQLQGNSISTNNDSLAVLLPYADSLITVGSNSTFSISNNNFQTSFLKSLFPAIDTIIDYGQHNNEWVFLAKKGPNYLIARYDDNVDFIDSFHLSIGCAIPTDIAFNDSVVAITGYEQIGENFRIFVKTHTLAGAHVNPSRTLSVLSSTIKVDSIISSQAFPISPKVYFAKLNAQLVVINNDINTIKSFIVYSDVIGFENCSRGYLNRRFDSLSMATGDTLHIEWDYYQNITSGYNIPMNFWLAEVNGGLMNNCSSFAYTETFFVDIEDIASVSVINVYPNPFESAVTFTNLPYDVNIEVYNLQGKAVLSTKANNDVTLDLSHLLPGMYIYNITNSHGQQLKTGKLIKE